LKEFLQQFSSKVGAGANEDAICRPSLRLEHGIEIQIVIKPEVSRVVTSASRANFSLEIGLEIRSMTNTGTRSQKIDDSRLTFGLRQRRWIIIDTPPVPGFR
jgi:hypothetical protein